MGETILNPIKIRPWPRWLKLRDAAEYSSFSPKRLKSLAETGDIIGFPDSGDKRGPKGDGVWIFDRDSIDDFRTAQAGQGAIIEAVTRLSKAM